MIALVLLVLAQPVTPVKNPGAGDGGTLLNINCVNCSSGSAGTSWFPDGGSIGSVAVTNFPATQPVSGAFFQTTQPVSLTSTTITGSVATTGPLTDTQLRTTPVPVSGTVATGGLTDTQLRATAVPVSGSVTATVASTTITGSVAVTGPLTDTLLRATPVPVSGSVTATVASTTITGSVAVTGSLTDTQLRAAAVPVSLASTTITGTAAVSAAALPLPAGASTSALQTTGNASAASVDAKTPALGQSTASGSRPVVIASDQIINVNIISAQPNPFTPRCNPVRRTGCIP